EYAAKAYALRDRVTEREKFDITSNYHSYATGDLLKAIETLELWKQTYPRDYGPRARLGHLYRLVGEYEKSLAAAREAHQLNLRAYVPFISQGTALVHLNRFDEAQAIINQAIEQQLATSTARRDLYYVALIKGDAATMMQQIEWVTGKPEEYWANHWQAQSASFAGRLQQAQEFYSRAASMAEHRYPDRAAAFVEEGRLRAAVCGVCRQVKLANSQRTAAPRISQQTYL